MGLAPASKIPPLRIGEALQDALERRKVSRAVFSWPSLIDLHAGLLAGWCRGPWIRHHGHRGPDIRDIEGNSVLVAL